MSSSWRTEWQALTAQISGLLEAASLYYASTVHAEGDTTPLNEVLGRHSESIYEQLKEFHRRAQHWLPERAAQRLAAFFNERGGVFLPGERRPFMRHRLIALASLRTEVDYLLSDFGIQARRLSDRAFAHLQRSIVADETVRDKWKGALKRKEPACEQLGAVHLLQHGIWAFKVNAEGERTDLVYRDRPVNLAEVERAAEALVLTEWKVVRAAGELERKITEAKRETERYSAGSLAGLELSDTRYLVMVGDDLPLSFPDRVEDGITYRPVGISVAPSSPSRAARKSDRSVGRPPSRTRDVGTEGDS